MHHLHGSFLSHGTEELEHAGEIGRTTGTQSGYGEICQPRGGEKGNSATPSRWPYLARMTARRFSSAARLAAESRERAAHGSWKGWHAWGATREIRSLGTVCGLKRHSQETYRGVDRIGQGLEKGLSPRRHGCQYPRRRAQPISKRNPFTSGKRSP